MKNEIHLSAGSSNRLKDADFVGCVLGTRSRMKRKERIHSMEIHVAKNKRTQQSALTT